MGVPAARQRQRRVLVGAVLRDARVAQGLTQVDVARRLGRAQSYVSKYESGELRVDVVALFEICAALEVRAVDLIEQVAVVLEDRAVTAPPAWRRTALPRSARGRPRSAGTHGRLPAP